MRNKTLFFLPICFLLYLHVAHAQDLTDLKPAKITLTDFDVQGNKSDSGTGAIILSDIGKRTFEKNEAGDEDIVLKRFIRIQIVNKNGLDAGNVTLHLNTQAQYHNLLMKLPDEGLVKLEGTTYNKINESIREVRLDQANVISQQEGKNWGNGKVCYAGTQCRIDF